MANFCQFEFEVRGKKNACYAFFGSTSAEDYSIEHEEGTDDNYVIHYSGSCKYYPDVYCEEWKKDTPVEIPADAKEALDKADEYAKYDVQSRSKMFGVDVRCNYFDMDALQEAMEYSEEEFDFSEGLADFYCHYINGEKVEDECPDHLLIYAEF